VIILLKGIYSIPGVDKSVLHKTLIVKIIEAFILSGPLIFTYLTLNGLVENKINYRNLVLYIAVCAACCIAYYFISYKNNMISYTYSFELIKNLRIRLGEHMRKLSMGFFTEKSAGELNAIVNGDVTNIEPVPSYVFQRCMEAILTPIMVSLSFIFINWKLTLVMFIGIPFSIPVFKCCEKILMDVMKKKQSSLSNLTDKTVEYIQGIKEIKAFNRLNSGLDNFDKAAEEFKKYSLNAETALLPWRFLFGTLIYLGFTLILFCAPYYYLNGNINTAEVLIFFLVSLKIYEPMQLIIDYSAILINLDTSLRNIEGVLNYETLSEKGSKKLLKHDIEFHKVSFKYEEKEVLKDVSFKVKERTITALVGASGSGKSTITNLLARFWDVNSGSIKIGGIDIRDVKTEELMNSISMVLQNTYLFNDTILNNIKIGNRNASYEDVIKVCKKAKCHEFIMNLPKGYNTVVGESGSTLSGGEKQRIAIARAILKDSPIVLLDEATASIDPENEREIQQALNKLVDNKTIIIIAHKLATIKEAHQIVVLDEGQIVEKGTHEELLVNKGIYSDFWSRRQKARNWKISRDG
jgi:ATP-binding cassette subfamily B protein